VQCPSHFKRQGFGLFGGLSSLLLLSLLVGCSRPTPSAQTSPSAEPPPPSSTSELGGCELAARDQTLSTAAALQKCLDEYHQAFNPLARFQGLPDGGSVTDLGNNRFALTLKSQDMLVASTPSANVTHSPLVTFPLHEQISMSISDLAGKCEALFTLFGQRGLTQINASLYSSGIPNQPGETAPVVERYRVLVYLSDLPKIQAWSRKQPSFTENFAKSTEVNAMWTVELNEYQRYEPSPSPGAGL
jgi:hypothetical protein